MKKSFIILFATIFTTFFGCGQNIQNVTVAFEAPIKLPNMDVENNLSPLVGFLISMPDTSLWLDHVSPLNINFWRTNEWDFQILTPLLEKYPNIHLQLVLGDQFPRKTYSKHSEIPFRNYSDWLKRSDELLSKIPAVYYNRISIDIYNEPNSERKWPNSYANFNRFFCESISFINAKYPELKIAGPSIAGTEAYDLIESTLNYMVNWKKINNDLPLRLDQLSIHALDQSPRKCIEDISKYKTLLEKDSLKDKLEISHIIYNEYCNRNQTHFFADAIRMLAAFEKEGIKYAARACWGSCHNGSLDNLLEYEDNKVKRNENWYGYKYYSLLDGGRFKVNASGEIASIAGDGKNGKICFIANYSNINQQISLSVTGIDTYYTYILNDNGLTKLDKFDDYELKKKQVLVLSERLLI